MLARWYGPEVETVIHKIDVTPGGLWLNEMKMGGEFKLSEDGVHGGSGTGKTGLPHVQYRRGLEHRLQPHDAEFGNAA
ncbi:hypothetical protein [Ciceribacter ferrooxidans]|uniref:hypothetical protein n=1 Tax=Ciceribacter ferrooxidans TaxID=2509717 RepID=UPI001FE09874|nr:hypothetical protein [Ciceribacter ferrooxidans]